MSEYVPQVGDKVLVPGTVSSILGTTVMVSVNDLYDEDMSVDVDASILQFVSRKKTPGQRFYEVMCSTDDVPWGHLSYASKQDYEAYAKRYEESAE